MKFAPYKQLKLSSPIIKPFFLVVNGVLGFGSFPGQAVTIDVVR